jgi:putative transposase
LALIRPYKEFLGINVRENKGAKFCLQVLKFLQNRALEDALIAWIDNPQGFADVMESIFPKMERQLCIVSQTKKSQKCFYYKDFKPFMKDLRCVYKAC